MALSSPQHVGISRICFLSYRLLSSRLCLYITHFFFSISDLCGENLLYLQRQLLVFLLCKGENDDAANYSLILAAFAPIRWRVLCLPPFFVMHKSQYGGASQSCRRAFRRQSGQNAPACATSWSCLEGKYTRGHERR